MKKRTLGFKLVSGGIAAVLIPLLVVGIFAAVKASDALEAAAKDRAMKGAHNLADMVQEVLAVELKVANELAISSDAVNAGQWQCGSNEQKAFRRHGEDRERL